MRDQRAEALAQILVRYSTRVQKGDVCVIQSTSAAEVLVQAVYEEVLRAGGHPIIQLSTTSAQSAAPLLHRGRGTVSGIADGNITGLFTGLPTAGLAIDTSASNGDIRLESGGAIGTTFAPIPIDAGLGIVSARTNGLALATPNDFATICIVSLGDMQIGSIVSDAAG